MTNENDIALWTTIFAHTENARYSAKSDSKLGEFDSKLGEFDSKLGEYVLAKCQAYKDAGARARARKNNNKGPFNAPLRALRRPLNIPPGSRRIL